MWRGEAVGNSDNRRDSHSPGYRAEHDEAGAFHRCSAERSPSVTKGDRIAEMWKCQYSMGIDFVERDMLCRNVSVFSGYVGFWGAGGVRSDYSPSHCVIVRCDWNYGFSGFAGGAGMSNGGGAVPDSDDVGDGVHPVAGWRRAAGVRSAYAATPNVTECEPRVPRKIRSESGTCGNRYCRSAAARLSRTGSSDCEFSGERIF